MSRVREALATSADDARYLTVDEFAELPTAAQHAVWQAYNEHRIDVIPVSRTTSTVYRYSRRQVADILRELEAARC